MTQLAVKVVQNSENSKLGLGMSATYTAFSTCSDNCPIKSECYGRRGHLAVNKVFGRMHDAGELVSPEEIAYQEADQIRRLAAVFPLRLHVVGDCKTEESARILAEAAQDYLNRGGPLVFGYTHSWREIPRGAWGPISIMASCETPQDCRDAMKRGYPAIVILPWGETPKESVAYYRSQGIRLRPCAHDLNGTTCKSCKACMDAEALLKRNLVVGIRASKHSKNKLSEKLRRWRG